MSVGQTLAQHPPLLNQPAPAFRARTTQGERALHHYEGRWLLLFAHPADFTAVCTSEFIAFSKAYPRFQARSCDLLGLSVDSLFSHLAWLQSIRERFAVQVPFPIIEDPSMAVARAYGMLHPEADSSATVRASFMIDPLGIIRAISWYPINVGRSVEELLRLLTALQTSDAHEVHTPEGWRAGEPALAPPPQSLNEHLKPTEGSDWYYQRVTVRAT